MVGDPTERLLAVKLLAASDKPDLEPAERLSHLSLSLALITILALRRNLHRAGRRCNQYVIVHMPSVGGE
jgi:hypothetical protein